jgi:hypothetical protein
MGFKQLCPHVWRNLVHDAKSARFFSYSKNDSSDNAFDLHFDFLIVRGDIYKSSTSINQPPTRKLLRGRGRCVEW